MSRMWMVPPEDLCDQHLLGEHAEIHQEIGQIRAGNIDSVRGHAAAGQIDTGAFQERHDELAREMVIRGFNHKSPLDRVPTFSIGSVDPDESVRVLIDRCAHCAKRLGYLERIPEVA